MKNEEVLNKLMEKSLEYLQSVEGFVIEHAPDYVKQLLEFEFYNSSLIVLFFLFAVILLVGLFFIGYRLYINESNYAGGFVIIIPVSALLISVFFTLEVIPSIQTMLKIKTAPKVFLVDKIGVRK